MPVAESGRPHTSRTGHLIAWSGSGAVRAEAGAFAADDLKLLHAIGSKINFSKGETIFNEGDPAEYTNKVISGTVRLCKHMPDGRRQIAQFLYAGDFFSFMELNEHCFTAESITETILVCYPQRKIERLGEERISLRRQFTAILTRRVRNIQNHLVMLGRQTAKERLASFLLVIIEQSQAENGTLIDIPMSRQDIADYLGLTIETVCRGLSAMKRDDLVSIPNLHQLLVKDIDGLNALADGDA